MTKSQYFAGKTIHNNMSITTAQSDKIEEQLQMQTHQTNKLHQ